jgi:hypothetical protein
LVSKSRLGVGDGVADGVGEAVGVGVGEAGVGDGDALSSPPQATTNAARASAVIKRMRAGRAAVGGP